MRTLNEQEIEKRAAIAAAKEAKPALSYRVLQQRFGTGPRVVASALSRPAAEWRALVDRRVATARNGWEFMGITVLGRVDGSDVYYETQEQGVAGWVASDAATLSDLLEEFGKQGWEPASITTIQHGALAFSGTFEVVLGRRA